MDQIKRIQTAEEYGGYSLKKTLPNKSFLPNTSRGQETAIEDH